MPLCGIYIVIKIFLNKCYIFFEYKSPHKISGLYFRRKYSLSNLIVLMASPLMLSVAEN